MPKTADELKRIFSQIMSDNELPPQVLKEAIAIKEALYPLLIEASRKDMYRAGLALLEKATAVTPAGTPANNLSAVFLAKRTHFIAGKGVTKRLRAEIQERRKHTPEEELINQYDIPREVIFDDFWTDLPPDFWGKLGVKCQHMSDAFVPYYLQRPGTVGDIICLMADSTLLDKFLERHNLVVSARSVNCAILSGDLQFLRSIIERFDLLPFDLDYQAGFLLLAAQQKSGVAFLRYLIGVKQIPADTKDHFGATALHSAVFFDRREAFEYLVQQHHLDVNGHFHWDMTGEDNVTPLVLVASKHDSETKIGVELLCSHGAYFHDEGERKLYFARYNSGRVHDVRNFVDEYHAEHLLCRLIKAKDESSDDYPSQELLAHALEFKTQLYEALIRIADKLKLAHFLKLPASIELLELAISTNPQNALSRIFYTPRGITANLKTVDKIKRAIHKRMSIASFWEKGILLRETGSIAAPFVIESTCLDKQTLTKVQAFATDILGGLIGQKSPVSEQQRVTAVTLRRYLCKAVIERAQRETDCHQSLHLLNEAISTTVDAKGNDVPDTALSIVFHTQFPLIHLTASEVDSLREARKKYQKLVDEDAAYTEWFGYEFVLEDHKYSKESADAVCAELLRRSEVDRYNNGLKLLKDAIVPPSEGGDHKELRRLMCQHHAKLIQSEINEREAYNLDLQNQKDADALFDTLTATQIYSSAQQQRAIELKSYLFLSLLFRVMGSRESDIMRNPPLDVTKIPLLLNAWQVDEKGRPDTVLSTVFHMASRQIKKQLQEYVERAKEVYNPYLCKKTIVQLLNAEQFDRRTLEQPLLYFQTQCRPEELVQALSEYSIEQFDISIMDKAVGFDPQTGTPNTALSAFLYGIKDVVPLVLAKREFTQNQIAFHQLVNKTLEYLRIALQKALLVIPRAHGDDQQFLSSTVSRFRSQIVGEMPFPYFKDLSFHKDFGGIFFKRVDEMLTFLLKKEKFQETEEFTFPEFMLYQSELGMYVLALAKSFLNRYDLLEEATGPSALNEILSVQHPHYEHVSGNSMPKLREEIRSSLKSLKKPYTGILFAQLVGKRTFSAIKKIRPIEEVVSYQEEFFEHLMEYSIREVSTNLMLESIALTEDGKPASALAEVFYYQPNVTQQPEQAEETEIVKKIKSAIPQVEKQIRIQVFKLKYYTSNPENGVSDPDVDPVCQGLHKDKLVKRTREIFQLLNGQQEIPGATENEKNLLLEEAIILKAFLCKEIMRMQFSQGDFPRTYEFREDSLGVWGETALSTVLMSPGEGSVKEIQDWLNENQRSYRKEKVKQLLPLLAGKKHFIEKEIGLSLERVRALSLELTQAIKEKCLEEYSTDLIDEALGQFWGSPNSALALILCDAAKRIDELKKAKEKIQKGLSQRGMLNHKEAIREIIASYFPTCEVVLTKNLEYIIQFTGEEQKEVIQARADALFKQLQGNFTLPLPEAIEEEAIMLKSFLAVSLEKAMRANPEKALTLAQEANDDRSVLSMIFRSKRSWRLGEGVSKKVKKILEEQKQAKLVNSLEELRSAPCYDEAKMGLSLDEAAQFKEALFNALVSASQFIGGLELLRDAIGVDTKTVVDEETGVEKETSVAKNALSEIFRHNDSTLFIVVKKIQDCIDKRERFGGESEASSGKEVGVAKVRPISHFEEL